MTVIKMIEHIETFYFNILFLLLIDALSRGLVELERRLFSPADGVSCSPTRGTSLLYAPLSSPVLPRSAMSSRNEA